MAYRIKECIRQHIFLLAFTLLGLGGGAAGVAIGAVCGIFADIILASVKEEFLLRNFGRHGGTRHVAEPFAGSIYLAALCTVCLQDADAAARLLHTAFAHEHRHISLAGWRRICANACADLDSNADLLCERLAAALQSVPAAPDLERIFTVLRSAEVAWNAEQGARPGDYLAQLLGYRAAQEQAAADAQLAAAYKTLGIAPDSPYAAVKKAHRRRAAQFHPDGVQADAAQFLAVQQAFDTITARRSYTP